MLKTIDKKEIKKSTNNSQLRDQILGDYYSNYFNSLSSRSLDKEFNRDLSIIIRSLKRLPPQERNNLVNYLASLVEFYIENKIEKELDKSFNIFFKL